jgi:glycosyltransferase involved in cell wall biosynthesis
MRILSITPAFAPQVGGVEQVVQELAIRLQGFGHEVEVAHVSTEHQRLHHDEIAGLKVHRVPQRRQHRQIRARRQPGWQNRRAMDLLGAAVAQQARRSAD